MKKSDGESSGSAGQPCPVLQKLQGSGNQNDAKGEVVPVVFVTPETLAVIGHALAADGIVPDGTLLAARSSQEKRGIRKSARAKLSGLLLLATGTTLVSALCYGSHCQTHENHKHSEARNFNCHTKVGRRRSAPLLAEGHKKDDQVSPQPAPNPGLACGHLLPSAEKARPECVARAEGCVNRLPDGRCRTTLQSCRLSGGVDEIKAMLSEIRAGVVGLAMGPPVACETHGPMIDNEFCRAGSHWDVTFDGGRTFHLRHALGVEYLNYLLHHPGQPISAYDLETFIRPDKATARAKDSIQHHLDADAVRDYLRQLDRLRAQRGEAAEDGDLATAGRLDDDIAAIENELTKNRQAPDTGERSRGNVRKAIAAVQRTLRKGNDSERRFGQHLEQFVSLGYECSYHQPPGIPWA